MSVIVREATYLLDIWFPNCHRCKKEMKPYILDQEEQFIIGKDFIRRLKEAHLTVETLSDGCIVILLCEDCLKFTEELI